jgi:hypothetical protein
MKRGPSLGVPLGATSHIGKMFESLTEGVSATFTRPLKVGDTRAATTFQQMLASYAARRLPGVRIGYQSFTAVTSHGLPIIGVIVTHCGYKDTEQKT